MLVFAFDSVTVRMRRSKRMYDINKNLTGCFEDVVQGVDARLRDGWGRDGVGQVVLGFLGCCS